MRSLPILSVAAALGASGMRIRPLGFGRPRIRLSQYMPHQGAKERERAKRCYMVSAFVGGPPRSAPVMCQMSKCQYEANFREVD